MATVRALERRFQGFTLKYIPRAENTKADELVKAVANNTPIPDRTFYEIFQAPATQATAKAFKTTNNIAEYEGLIFGFNKAKALGAKTVLAKIDSQVMAGQVEKEYVTREPELAKYLAIVRALERKF